MPSLSAVPTETRAVAAYLRLSIAREESVSIAAQRRLAADAARQRGWATPVFFEDEGVSGSKDVARPARDELERRIANGEFSALIVKSVDRLARSAADFARIVKVAKDNGCALVVTDLGLDASTPVGAMVVGILAQVAEFEAAMISARVKESNRERRGTGRALGGPIAYGLRNVRRNGVAVREVDPEKAATVRRMATWAINGQSLRAIASALNDEDVPAPRGARWDPSSVRRVLTNPALIGAERHGNDLVRDVDGLPTRNSEAVVLDVATFQAVGEAVRDRSDAVPRRAPNGQRLLLDGIARCACGRRMTRQTTHRGRYVNYLCSGAPRLRCDAPATVSARELDAFVISRWLDEVGHVGMTTVRSTEDPAALERVRLARAEVAQTIEAMRSAAPDEVSGLAERLATLKATEAAAREAVASRSLSLIEELGITYGERFHQAGEDERRRLIAAFFGSVLVSRTPDGRRQDVAERVQITVL